jgi:peptidoglycan/xylan/chitin deacetylase (PgdA/CDA1 family)
MPGLAADTPQTVAILDSANLTAGLMLAPVTQADRNSQSATVAPVEPLLSDFSPHMPDYDISDRITTVARGNSRRKQVALTFDDGPHPEFTSQILAVLDQYDVPATFFFVGVQAQKYPHWVKMVHQAGHEIGSHTYDHFRLPKMPRQEKIYQIDEYQRLIEGLTGETPRFLRPPGGQIDAESEQLLADRHMVLAMWDVALNDTREDKTSEMIYKTAKSEIRSGSVVLLHDGIQATVDMLPELITQLKNQGFEFVTMSELAAGM